MKTLSQLFIILIALSSCARIDPEWVTLPADEAFKWMDWKDCPNVIKKATKQIPHDTVTLYEAIKEYEVGYGGDYGGCDVQIALLDLNENGIYGFAVAAVGRDCCSPSSPECMVSFMDDGGILRTDLGLDHPESVTPLKKAVSSSTSRKFPFKTNPEIDQETKEKLLTYFKYK